MSVPPSHPGCSTSASSVEPDRTREFRLWARVEYDGSDFAGFQVQAQERTVQGEIERAIQEICGVQTRIIGAGRTDGGVHARGQIVAFETGWQHGLDDLQRALNAVLATDVAILELGEAAEGFHPRFSALSRTYEYSILNQRWPSPLVRRTAWHVVDRLDVSLMAEAGEYLAGRHDFKTFGRPPQGNNTVRQVFGAAWRERCPLLAFEIEADAFLYRMVRSIVGSLVLVGRGQISVQEFGAMIEARDRSLVRQVAPAHGLCMTRVNYPEGVLQ